MYPIMLQLAGKKIIVIGGGHIALRKTRELVKAQGQVTVISPRFLPEFTQLNNVTLLEATYQAEQLAKAQLIFACTDNPSINQQIVKDAKEFQWVNNCSQREQSDFYNMGTIERQEYLLAISTYGKNPAFTKKIKAQLMEHLEE